MSQIKIWLIRHGQSLTNAGEWSANPASTQLSALGKVQAQELAAQIITAPDIIVCSPLVRAQETAQYIIEAWPETRVCTWPIQEIIYLSPSKLHHLNAAEKKERIAAYWQKSDPYYCDGEDAESFASFVQRVHQFHHQLLQQRGFILVVGHGQFFKAYQLGLIHGFEPSKEWMQWFRQQETTNPLKNGEWIEVSFAIK